MRHLARAAMGVAIVLAVATGPGGAHDDDHHAAGVQFDHWDVLTVPETEMPALALEMAPGGAGGWHLRLATERFAFADGEHALLHVNGEQATRIDAPDHELAPLPEGLNLIEVYLLDNDDRLYAGEDGRLAGERVFVEVAAAGEPFPPVAETFEAGIEDGRLTTGEETIRVRNGDTVAIRWTVDEPTVLHLHGYDIEFDVQPQTATTVMFVADSFGRFPLERHGVAHEAPIQWLEVTP